MSENPLGIPAYTATPDDDGDKFFGVSDDYLATVQRPGNPNVRTPDRVDPGFTQVAPRYGPDTAPNLADLPSEIVTKIQRSMRIAGLIGKETVLARGMVDNNTQAAWEELLSISNRQGLDWQTTLSRLTTDPTSGREFTTPAGTRTSQTTRNVSVTDPMTARTQARQTWQSRLGRAPTSKELSAFEDALNAYEKANPSTTTTDTTSVTLDNGTQDDEANVENAATTTSMTTPTADVFADEYTRKGKLGVEANTRTAGTDYFDAVLRLVGGG